jgi:hypothetical protein
VRLADQGGGLGHELVPQFGVQFHGEDGSSSIASSPAAVAPGSPNRRAQSGRGECGLTAGSAVHRPCRVHSTAVAERSEVGLFNDVLYSAQTAETR